MNRRMHQIPQSAGRFRNGAVLSLALGAVIILTACSSSDGKNEAVGESPSASSRPTGPASVDPEQVAKDEVIARYRTYWKEMQRVYAHASVEGTDIEMYAASAALVRTKSDSERMRKNGRVITGTVSVNGPTAIVHLDRKVPNATITSCLDVSQWKVIAKDTGKPAQLPSTRLTKYITVATLERWDDEWKVIRDEPQTGRPC
ncbi:hypothetical protein [Streptomyces sp. NPDC004230]